ncbi:MAG: NADH-quinone oxidoreductase subunit L [Blastopirellula sp.]|nr:MAG: NADH-quinone oxidoreductase subunit L [Blastopirellula sp.]
MGVPDQILPILLGLAVLAPLASFVIILLFGPNLGKQGVGGAYVATGAIVCSAILSFLAGFIWLSSHMPPATVHHHDEHHEASDHAESKQHGPELHGSLEQDSHFALAKFSEEVEGDESGEHQDEEHGEAAQHDADADDAENFIPPVYTGHWYSLGRFMVGTPYEADVSINYYIDSLTIIMFCMVTFIASCIHFYASGYMHDELHEFTDPEVIMKDGSNLVRPGRYHRFFQYLSLFCFSMLGLVLAGNIAMTFVFWELVGICSYFLIGFYVERHSASTAANKAFIVNRIGDFGMLIGLMALWASLGTFNFGDIDRNNDGTPEEGLFSLMRPEASNHKLQAPDGMVALGAKDRIEELVLKAEDGTTREELEDDVAEMIPVWREGELEEDSTKYGYTLLVIAGLGIFCGCVGKSAQFPLHTWLPDAMEGPTPVSALVHSATMVAAGVFLVARFYPVFAPEVLFVIACTGCITLFIGATIAIVATDIKRVLAYSTVSQLGYMMLALGLGGWTAGVMHLVTHAFFKSLLFMCSGSVIHAVHTNEMTEMGGLRKKMPFTAYTMLVGCIAIAGVGIPSALGLPFGLSGYYSKDSILEQAYSYMIVNPIMGSVFFYAALGGAVITAFYMFRMWFLTFAGEPRDQKRYDHAHESPKVMYVPLVILAVMAAGVAWPFFGELGTEGDTYGFGLYNFIEQGRPLGLWLENDMASNHMFSDWLELSWPHESKSHAANIKGPVGLMAIGTAILGISLAAAMYLWRFLNPEDARKAFAPIYNFLVNKWKFDEAYNAVFVKPTHVVAWCIATFDKQWIDRFLESLVFGTRRISGFLSTYIDKLCVDGLINGVASRCYSIGHGLQKIQTGSLRQYVMFIVVGTITVFVLLSFWSYAIAQ